MIRRRVAIGLGLGTLLAVGSASVALDLKSRDDAALVDHTMEVLQKSSDLRLLLRQVESASRAFALTADDRFVAEFQDARQRVPAALADLL
ncbi:MAG: CHASE3 domain-containing protein, partial [Bradyrhizobium sp.]|nr:CHASE3 domain-containing protein [Bradyrhizobium sp.]